jgi:hypothetical protein
VAAERGFWDEARQQAEESLRLFQQIGYYQAAEVQRWLERLAGSAAEGHQAATVRSRKKGSGRP